MLWSKIKFLTFGSWEDERDERRDERGRATITYFDERMNGTNERGRATITY